MSVSFRFFFATVDELRDAHERDLRHGRALHPEVLGLARGQAADAVLECLEVASQRALEVRVEAKIEAGPMRGTVLSFGAARDETFETFVGAFERVPVADATMDLPSLELEHLLRDVGHEAGAERRDDSSDHNAEDGNDGDETEDDRPLDHAPHLASRALQIRNMTAGERLKLARVGHLEDRVALERSFGRDVWEALLRNPGITIPEVARLAAKGTVPRPLLDFIVDNAAFSRQPLVRRALLLNPRVGDEAHQKLVRTVPKSELKALALSPAYPMSVRMRAKKRLSDET